MIELRDVVVAYESRVILDSINLTIDDGETLVILGGSGSGKSTLLRLLIGFTASYIGTDYCRWHRYYNII